MKPGVRIRLDVGSGFLQRGVQDPSTGIPVDGAYLVVRNGALGTVVGSAPGARSVMVQFDGCRGVGVSVDVRELVEKAAETEMVPCILCSEVRSAHPVELVAEPTSDSPHRGRRSCPIWVPEIRDE